MKPEIETECLGWGKNILQNTLTSENTLFIAICNEI